jgi:hypothetical protein
VLALAGGAVFNVALWRRGVAITAHEVVVRNLIRTYRVPLANVARALPGRDGVTIYTMDGQTIVARAITQDPFARLTRQRSMADELAYAIVNAARSAAGMPAQESPTPVPVATRWLVLIAAVGLASLIAAGFMGNSPLGIIPGVLAGLCFMVPGSYWMYRRRQRRKEHSGK